MADKKVCIFFFFSFSSSEHLVLWFIVAVLINYKSTRVEVYMKFPARLAVTEQQVDSSQLQINELKRKFHLSQATLVKFGLVYILPLRGQQMGKMKKARGKKSFHDTG